MNKEGTWMQKVYNSIVCVLNKLNKITDVCCGIKNASSKIMTKLFVKQHLPYCEQIDELQDKLLTIPWNCGRRDEPLRRKPQCQQQTFHNCRSRQWQVMYYEGSHFTFWIEFSTEKKIFNCTKHYGLHMKEYWKMVNNLMKELGKKQNIFFNLIETNYQWCSRDPNLRDWDLAQISRRDRNFVIKAETRDLTFV